MARFRFRRETGRRGVAVLFCFVLFVGCSRKDPSVKAPTPEISSPETATPAEAPAPSPDPNRPAKAVESTEIRQGVAEAEKSLRSGSYDEAAARLLKMRISGVQFSEKDAAAYRNTLQEAYSRALEAADKGDPRGKAAVEMIRAARAR